MPTYKGVGNRASRYQGMQSSPFPYYGAGVLFANDSAGPPTYVGATPFVNGTGAITPTFASSGRLTGDLLLLFVESANQAVTTPAGWTLLGTQSIGTAAAAGGVRLTVFGKKSDGTETTVSINDTGDHTTAIGSVYRGVDTTSVTNLLQNSNDSTNATYWTTYGNGAYGTVSIATSVIAGPGGGSPGCRLQLTSPTGAQADSVGIYTDDYAALKPSTTYTILMYARGTSATQKFALSGYMYNGSDNSILSPDITVTTTWTRQKHTFTTLSSFSYTNIAVIPDSALNSCDIQIAQFMLIEGDADINTLYVATTSEALTVFTGITIAGQTQAATTAVSFAGLTAPVDNCLVVNAIANDRDAASTSNLSSVTNSSLSSLTTRLDQTVTDGVGGGLGIITGLKGRAGTVSGTTATNAASVTNASMTLVLAPPIISLTTPSYIGWNKTALEASGMTFSNNDRTVVGNNPGNTNDTRCISAASVSVGKIFASVSIDVHEYRDISITDSNDSHYVHYAYDGMIWSSIGSQLATLAGYSAPCVIDIAFDADAHLVWFRLNGGDWNGNASYDPAAGTGGYTVPTSTLPYHIKVNIPYYSNAQRTINSGSESWTYSPPSGFSPLYS